MTMSISSDDRIQALSRHLETVACRAEEAGRNGGEADFDSFSGRIRLTMSETSMVLSALSQADESEGNHAALLLAQTAALCLKASEELRDYLNASQIDPELEQKISQSLDLDLAICEGLVGDFGEVIEAALKEGDRDQAVRLGEFRLALRQQMAAIRRALEGVDPTPDDDHCSDGEVGAEAATDLETPDEGVEPDEQFEKSRKRHAKLKRERLTEEREKEKWRRLRVLLMIVGVGAVTAAVSLAIQLLPVFDFQTTPVLKMSDFEDIPVIASVEAHPPSLFVRVQETHWRKLNGQRQLEVVRKVGRILNKAGYNGARVRTGDGTLVGEWIREVGTFVYPRP